MVLALLALFSAQAAELHVAKTGSDANAGTAAAPFLTVNRAATVAQPGDTVWVHAGEYREAVNPVRGGTSEAARITYSNAPGEQVTLKGSERITSWVSQGGGVWLAQLPSTFFGSYNPYALNLTGTWLTYGGWHHRGDVYLNGDALYEKQTLAAVQSSASSWYCEVNGATTSIWANFGSANPNSAVAEINVRETVFFPQTGGLRYITVRGFTIMHSAENWQEPNTALQKGAIGTHFGFGWVLEDLRVVNARCVGISLGRDTAMSTADIETYGHHVVRRNTVQRCGHAGISGTWGAVASEIHGNLIEDVNYRQEFGGWEGAGIKFHFPIDTHIHHNLIRRVRGPHTGGAFGIWLDWGAQGTRVSSNVIYDTDFHPLHLEVNHGPVLVDNNVVMSSLGFFERGEATVFAHNLFFSTSAPQFASQEQNSAYFVAHRSTRSGTAFTVYRDDKWFNNVFVQVGLDAVPAGQNYAANWNVYYRGARKSSWDSASIVDSLNPLLSLQASPTAVTLQLTVNQAPFSVASPLITHALVGPLGLVNQGLEWHDGSPIAVDRDFFGWPRSPTAPVAGPFEQLQAGANTFTLWNVGGPNPAPTDLSTFVTQSVPGAMVAGQRYPVSVAFKNVGNTTWTLDAGYALGSLNGTTWGTAQVSMPAGVAVDPGKSQTFSFQATAPSAAGSYPFQWRMLHQAVGAFGAPSTAVQITVTPAPDAGRDAGIDAGRDAGIDAGRDAGIDAGRDAGADAGRDAGADAGRDAGQGAGRDGGADAGGDLPDASVEVDDGGTDAAPEEQIPPTPVSGCACTTAGAGPAALVILVLLALRARRRAQGV